MARTADFVFLPRHLKGPNGLGIFENYLTPVVQVHNLNATWFQNNYEYYLRVPKDYRPYARFLVIHDREADTLQYDPLPLIQHRAPPPPQNYTPTPGAQATPLNPAAAIFRPDSRQWTPSQSSSRGSNTQQRVYTPTVSSQPSQPASRKSETAAGASSSAGRIGPATIPYIATHRQGQITQAASSAATQQASSNSEARASGSLPTPSNQHPTSEKWQLPLAKCPGYIVSFDDYFETGPGSPERSAIACGRRTQPRLIPHPDLENPLANGSHEKNYPSRADYDVARAREQPNYRTSFLDRTVDRSYIVPTSSSDRSRTTPNSSDLSMPEPMSSSFGDTLSRSEEAASRSSSETIDSWRNLRSSSFESNSLVGSGSWHSDAASSSENPCEAVLKPATLRPAPTATTLPRSNQPGRNASLRHVSSWSPLHAQPAAPVLRPSRSDEALAGIPYLSLGENLPRSPSPSRTVLLTDGSCTKSDPWLGRNPSGGSLTTPRSGEYRRLNTLPQVYIGSQETQVWNEDNRPWRKETKIPESTASVIQPPPQPISESERRAFLKLSTKSRSAPFRTGLPTEKPPHSIPFTMIKAPGGSFNPHPKIWGCTSGIRPRVELRDRRMAEQPRYPRFSDMWYDTFLKAEAEQDNLSSPRWRTYLDALDFYHHFYPSSQGSNFGNGPDIGDEFPKPPNYRTEPLAGYFQALNTLPCLQPLPPATSGSRRYVFLRSVQECSIKCK